MRSPQPSLCRSTNGPGSPSERYTCPVRTLFPLQLGKAVPCSQPICLHSQLTSQVPSALGTPTIVVRTPRDGISNQISVPVYASSDDCAGNSVNLPGAKPVLGRALKAPPAPPPPPPVFRDQVAMFETETETAGSVSSVKEIGRASCRERV